MLDAPELKRRLDAFRTLRGMRQIDLAALLEEDGHDKTALGRIERGDDRVPFSPSIRRSVATHLQIPEDWLTNPELHLLGPATADDGATLAGNSEKLDTLANDLDELRELILDSTEKVLVARIEIQTRVLQRLEQIDDRIADLDRRFGQVTQLDDTTVAPLVRRALEAVADETRARAERPASPPRHRQGSTRGKTPPAAGSDPDGRQR